MIQDLQADVERFFGERLRELPGYEHRPQQLAMAAAVARAFTDEEILVAEAGTGTGKSLAYLVPALLWRLSGGKEPVIVATRTLTLQQQILDVDVPRLRDQTGLPFRAVQARGWSNYLCLRRMHSVPRSGELTPHEERLVEGVTAHVARGGGGTRPDIPVPDELWARLACESTACARQRCPLYDRCFLFQERRQLEGADLVITNHALLLSDLAMRREGAQGILPGLSRVILDEAHHLEETATDHLSYGFVRSDFFRLLQQLYKPKATTEEGGFLAGLRISLASAPVDADRRRDLLATVDRGLLAPIPALAHAAEEFLGWLGERVGREDKVALTPAFFQGPVGEEARESGARLAARLTDASSALREISERLDDLPDWSTGQALRVEVNGFADRLGSVKGDLEFCLYPEDPDWVFWVDHNSRDTAIGAAPLDVGPHLANLLFKDARTAVLTSATLTVGGSTHFLQDRIGLQGESYRVQELIVESPFEWERQALVAVARGLPDPGDPGFTRAIVDHVAHLVREIGGGTFLLVTSWKMLHDLKRMLQGQLDDVQVLAQGDADRSVLLNRFRDGGRYLLLGTDSFWEGVDVPGDALRCVILAKLPFRVPTEPVHQARSARLEGQGRDAFRDYHLPLAVVKFRQGFGRLIRTTTDRGVVLVLDGRLKTKSYGKTFLQSLPPARQQVDYLDRLVEDCITWIHR